MSGRQAAIIAAIVLTALVVVGLILLRPMSPEAYAQGDFSFEAVTEIRVSAGTFEYGAAAQTLVIDPENEAFETLIGFFDGKGFGRTPLSVFSRKPPVKRVGDFYWSVTFLALNGASLTADYIGGDLRLGGEDSPALAAQDKLAWARELHDLILSLYPEPEPDVPEDTGVPENT